MNLRKLATAATLLMLILLSMPTIAQVLNNNPPKLRWQHLFTPHFEVIYPEGYEEQAQHVANVLEHSDSAVAASLAEQPRRVPIILQNQTSVSNGFATLTPRRSEFFTVSPQDFHLLGTNDWSELLAIHEYRHIVQFSKSRTGFNKLVHLVSGNQGLANVAHWQVPDWFWEGDATVTETALTESGRGRIPHFYRNFRATLLEEGIADYDQQHLGSFKDFYPGEYVLGYHFVSWLRKNEGKMAPEAITEATWRSPFRTFSSAMRKETGKNLDGQYLGMMQSLRDDWQQETEAMGLSDATILNPMRHKETYTDYLYPQPAADGSVIALKQGLADIASIVRLSPKGEETLIWQPGIVNDTRFLSLSQNKLAWTEYEFHPRWRMLDYSVIKTIDLETGRIKRLSKKSRYHGAAFNASASKILTFEMPVSGQGHYVILDANSGQVLSTVPNPTGALYLSGRWDGDQILAIRHHERGHQIVHINPATGAETPLYDAGADNISHPVAWGEYIFFNSPGTGTDQLYALHKETGQRYCVSNRPYGAYNAIPGGEGDKLYFNDFTARGMNTASMDLDPERWELVSDGDAAAAFPIAAQVQEEEGAGDLLASVPSKTYQSKRFNTTKGFFTPHSWGTWYDEDRETYQLGIYTQNLLSTARLSAGLEFDDNQQQLYRFGNLSFQGWFPIFDVGMSSARLERAVTLNGTTVPYSFKQRRITAGISIPLILTHSRWLESFRFGTNIGRIFNTGHESPADSLVFNDVRLLTSTTSLSYARLLKTARRDIYSRWGYTLSMRFSDTPGDNIVEGGQFAIDASLYLPGFWRHHSLRLRMGYQREDADNFTFGPAIRYPRGLVPAAFHELTGLSGEYTMPLWYPDLSIGSLLNIQRLRVNAYYDYARGLSPGLLQDLHSIGFELTADYNLFRIQNLLSTGVRVGYLPLQGGSYVDILFGGIGF